MQSTSHSEASHLDTLYVQEDYHFFFGCKYEYSVTNSPEVMLLGSHYVRLFVVLYEELELN